MGTLKVDISSLQTPWRRFLDVTAKLLAKTGDFGVSLKNPTKQAHMSLQCQDMVPGCLRSYFGLGLPNISAFESQVLSWGITEISGKRWFFTKTGISFLWTYLQMDFWQELALPQGYLEPKSDGASCREKNGRPRNVSSLWRALARTPFEIFPKFLFLQNPWVHTSKSCSHHFSL